MEVGCPLYELVTVLVTQEQEILIQGLQNLNRAIQGDIVAVELFPKEKWSKPFAEIKLDEYNETEGAYQTEAIETAYNPESSEIQPTGRVVSILKRNWKPYVTRGEY